MILMYHKVFLESPTTWWVDVNNFYRQMSELKCKKVVYLDEYDVNDKNQVVITFDGIYKNVLEYAALILKDFGYPFELFVTSDYMGEDNSFDACEPRAVFASTEDLKILVDSGGRLQWHSRTHQNLKNIKDLEKIHYELSVPEELRLLDKKGFKWFACPHGDFDEIVVEETKKQFMGGVSCIQGNDYDSFKLNRTTVTNETSFKKGSIAVIIASYNYGSFLVEAIESVLRQTRPADEILIADDYSNDNTMEIALEYQKAFSNLIKYMRNEENLGIVKNFNKAVYNTTSDYICFLGADNRLRSDYIEKTAEILDSDDSIGIAYSDFALFGARAKIVYDGFPSDRKGDIKQGYYYVIKFPDFNEESKRELLEVGNFMHGSSMYKRKAFHDAGGYKEEKNQPEDYNLFLRIVKGGWDAKRVPDPILEYRQHSRNQTNIKLNSFIELIHYKEQVKRLQDTVREKDTTLNNIYNSQGWRALLIYYRLRDKLLPTNSKRRIIAKNIFTILWKTLFYIKKTGLYVKQFGVKALFHKIKDKMARNRIKSIAYHITRGIYLGLPISLEARNKLKSWVFIACAPLIRSTTAYRNWAALWAHDAAGSIRHAPVPGEAVKNENNKVLKYKPLISIVTPTYNTKPHYLDELVESLGCQTYDNWELCIADGGSSKDTVDRLLYWQEREKRIKIRFLKENKGIAGNSIEAYDLSKGEYIVLLDHDDYLSSDALMELANSINENPDVDFIYSDRAIFLDESREILGIHYLPGFSPDFLRAYNYASHLNVFSRWIIEEVGFIRLNYDGSQDYDFELRVIEKARRVMSIPKVLYFCRACQGSVALNPESKMYAYEAGRRAIEEHIKRIGCEGEVEFMRTTYSYRIHYQIKGNPLVSIIIPNKDHLEDLKKCINSITSKSTYKNYEIIIVENNSKSESIFTYYDELKKTKGIDVIRYEGKDFNFSAINNYAVQFANGEHIVLLNNDTKIITPNWIEEMLAFSQREDVGAVGAKLYYADNRIQHAGLIIGLAGSIASHYNYGSERSNTGYMHRLVIPQNYCAVTGACLMVKKMLYLHVDGLDVLNFKVGLNDVDFCLKLREIGKINVWTPFAELYHFESVSRGLDTTSEKAARLKEESSYFREKWKSYYQYGDPYHNEGISG